MSATGLYLSALPYTSVSVPPNMFSAKRTWANADLYDKKTTSPRAAFDPKYRIPNCWFIPTAIDCSKYKKSLLTHRRRLPPRIPNLRPYTKSFAPHDCEFTFKSRPLTTETTLKNRQLKRLRYPPLRLPRNNPKWEKAFFVPIGIRTPEARREMAGRVISALLDDITIDLCDLELNSPPNLASPASSAASSPRPATAKGGYPSPIARPRPTSPACASPIRASPTSFAPTAASTSPYPSPIARPSPSKTAPPVTTFVSAASDRSPPLASPPVSFFPSQIRSASGWYYGQHDSAPEVPIVAKASRLSASDAALSPQMSPEVVSLMADFSADFLDQLGLIISDMDQQHQPERTYPSDLALSPEYPQSEPQQEYVYSERWPQPELFLQRQVYAQQEYPRQYSYSQQYQQAQMYSQQQQQEQAYYPQQYYPPHHYAQQQEPAAVNYPSPSLVEMYMQRTSTSEYQQFFDDIECDDYSESYSFSNSAPNSYTDPYEACQDDEDDEDGPFIYTGIDSQLQEGVPLVYARGIVFAGVDYADYSGISECFDSPPTSSVGSTSTSSAASASPTPSSQHSDSPCSPVSLGSPADTGSQIPSPMETSLPLLNDSDDTESWVHVPLGYEAEEEAERDEDLFLLVTGAGDGAGTCCEATDDEDEGEDEEGFASVSLL